MCTYLLPTITMYTMLIYNSSNSHQHHTGLTDASRNWKKLSLMLHILHGKLLSSGVRGTEQDKEKYTHCSSVLFTEFFLSSSG
jgi:hypothetical protein